MGIVRDSFVVFKNWIEAINKMPQKYQLETYKALANYGITGEIPSGLSTTADAMLTAFSVGMKNNILRYTTSVENGKLGGAPKGNSNAKKKDETQKVIHNLEEKTTQNNLEQPKTSKNNLDVNVNSKLVNYILNNNNNAHTREIEQKLVDNFKDYLDEIATDKLKQQTVEILEALALMQSQTNENGLFKYKGRIYKPEEIANLIVNLKVEDLTRINNALLICDGVENKTSYIIGCVLNMFGNFEEGVGYAQ